MHFAKWVFRLAGIIGLLMIIPPYFLEKQFGQDHPPPVNHPEFYYGFFGVTLAWQLMFLVIASDPIRYRPAMLPAIVEKASFPIAIVVLYAFERVPASNVAFASIDATWLVLFIVAFWKTGQKAAPVTSGQSG